MTFHDLINLMQQARSADLACHQQGWNCRALTAARTGVGFGDEKRLNQTPVSCPGCSAFCAETNSTVGKHPGGWGGGLWTSPKVTKYRGLGLKKGQRMGAGRCGRGAMFGSHTRPQNKRASLATLHRPTIERCLAELRKPTSVTKITALSLMIYSLLICFSSFIRATSLFWGELFFPGLNITDYTYMCVYT